MHTQGLYTGVRTSDIDSLAAETAAYLTTDHPGSLHRAIAHPMRVLQNH